MKLLLLYSCLLTILLQAISASTFPNGKDASLRSKPRPKAKPVAGQLGKKEKPQGKTNLVVKEDRPKSLSELLPKTLVEIVISYFKDDIYLILVSTHDWLLAYTSRIAVDSARVYVITDSDGIKGLNHSSANLMESSRTCIEFGDPQWSNYVVFRSSHDGRYVFFSHFDKASARPGQQAKRSLKWLTQSNELGDDGFKRVAFDGKDFPYGLLSRDGQALFCYSGDPSPVRRAYQIKEEIGKDPIVSMSFELTGMPRAVSGKGNRVVVTEGDHAGIYDIRKGAGELVCQINRAGHVYACALNEDGREAALITGDGVLRIMKVDKVAGDKVDQPAIVAVNVPKSLGSICQLVYSGGNSLHALHNEGIISLFDPPTKTLVSVEAPEEGQQVTKTAISPDADYIATLQCIEKEKDGRYSYRTIVKRKLGSPEWKGLFGYETDKAVSSRIQRSAEEQ